MNTKTDTLERLPASAGYASELSAAFEKAQRWCWQEDRRSPLSGFGRGFEMGEQVLKRFMPDWFQSWMKTANWHPAGLLQGEKGWWSYVHAFGLTTEQWWERVKHNASDQIRKE